MPYEIAEEWNYNAMQENNKVQRNKNKQYYYELNQIIIFTTVIFSIFKKLRNHNYNNRSSIQ